MKQKFTISELEDLIPNKPQLRQQLLDYGWLMVDLGRTKQLLEETESQGKIDSLTEHLAQLEDQKPLLFSENPWIASLYEQRLFPPSLLPVLQQMLDEKFPEDEESDVEEYLEIAECLPESALSISQWIEFYKKDATWFAPPKLITYPESLSLTIIEKRALAKALKTDNTITILELRGLNLKAESIRIFFKRLKNFYFQQVNLRYVDIDKKIGAAFANVLGAGATLKKCSLSNCKISNKGAVELAKALQTNPHVEVFALDECEITNEGIAEFAKALEKNTTLKSITLSTRAREPNQNINDAGVAELAKRLKKNTCLEELTLSSAYIGDEGLLSLAEVIKSHVSLKKFTLHSSTMLDNKGVAALATIIQANTILEEFSLPNFHAHDDTGSIVVFGEALKKNTHLKKFTVLISNCGTHGIESLAKALETNATLEELNLLNGFISNESAAALIKSLEVNMTTVINIDESAVSDVKINLKNKLKSLIKRNKTYLESKQKIDRCLHLLKEKLSEKEKSSVREEQIIAEDESLEAIQLWLAEAHQEALKLRYATPQYPHAEKLLHEVYCQMAMTYAKYGDYSSFIVLYFDYFISHPDLEFNLVLASLLMPIEDKVYALVKLEPKDKQKLILSLLGGNYETQADALRSQALRLLKGIKAFNRETFAEAAGIPNATIITFSELIVLIEEQSALERAEQEAIRRESQMSDSSEGVSEAPRKKVIPSRPETLLEKVKTKKIQLAVYEQIITEPNKIIFVDFQGGLFNAETFQKYLRPLKKFQKKLMKLTAIPFNAAISVDPHCFEKNRTLFPQILKQLSPTEINFIFSKTSDANIRQFFNDLKNVWEEDESIKDLFFSALSTASIVIWNRFFHIFNLDELSKLNLAALAEESIELRQALADWLKVKLNQPSKEFLDFVGVQKLLVIPGLVDLIIDSDVKMHEQLLEYGLLMFDLGKTKQLVEEKNVDLYIVKEQVEKKNLEAEINSLTQQLVGLKAQKNALFSKNSWLGLIYDQFGFSTTLIPILVEKRENDEGFGKKFCKNREKKTKKYLETARCLHESILTMKEWADKYVEQRNQVFKDDVFDISRSGSIGGRGRGIRLFVKALKTDTVIKIFRVNIPNKEEIKILSALPKILKKNKTLNELDLSDREINTETAEALAEVLKIKSSITKLNLSKINLDDTSFAILVNTLKINTTLKELKLDQINLTKEKVKLLGEALKANKTLTHISLLDNGINDENVKLLAEALPVNQLQFISFNLCGNLIGVEGLKALEGKLPVVDRQSLTAELNDKVIKLAKLRNGIFRKQQDRKKKEDRHFLEDMSKSILFKKLTERIPEIKARESGWFGQDPKKNSDKAQALTFLRDEILKYDSVQEFYNQIKDREPVIRASTRSDKDFCWFPRGEVDSIPFLEQILGAFLRYDAHLEENYLASKKENVDSHLIRDASAST